MASMDMSLSKLQEMVKDRETWMVQSTESQRVGRDLANEQQDGPASKGQGHTEPQPIRPRPQMYYDSTAPGVY